MYTAKQVCVPLLFRHDTMSTKLSIISLTVQRTINCEDNTHVFTKQHVSTTVSIIFERWCMILDLQKVVQFASHLLHLLHELQSFQCVLVYVV